MSKYTYAKQAVTIDGKVYNAGDILPAHAKDAATLVANRIVLDKDNEPAVEVTEATETKPTGRRGRGAAAAAPIVEEKKPDVVEDEDDEDEEETIVVQIPKEGTDATEEVK